MKVQFVPAEYVHQTWPFAASFIEKALAHSQGDYSLEQVKALVALGAWAMFVAVNENHEVIGASTVTFLNRPNDRVAFITAIGGKLVTNTGTWQQFTDLLKAQGATYIEGAVRPSMLKLWKKYGATEKYRIAGVKI